MPQWNNQAVASSLLGVAFVMGMWKAASTTPEVVAGACYDGEGGLSGPPAGLCVGH